MTQQTHVDDGNKCPSVGNTTDMLLELLELLELLCCHISYSCYVILSFCHFSSCLGIKTSKPHTRFHFIYMINKMTKPRPVQEIYKQHTFQVYIYIHYYTALQTTAQKCGEPRPKRSRRSEARRGPKGRGKKEKKIKRKQKENKRKAKKNAHIWGKVTLLVYTACVIFL